MIIKISSQIRTKKHKKRKEKARVVCIPHANVPAYDDKHVDMTLIISTFSFRNSPRDVTAYVINPPGSARQCCKGEAARERGSVAMVIKTTIKHRRSSITGGGGAGGGDGGEGGILCITNKIRALGS